jgi:DNA-binding transcriptional ArsR family regulator
MDRLRVGPLPVGELARGLPVSRPAVSQHLRVLKAAGLVVGRPVGTRRLYGIDPRGIDALRRYVEDYWDAALAAYAAYADDEQAAPARRKGSR